MAVGHILLFTCRCIPLPGIRNPEAKSLAAKAIQISKLLAYMEGDYVSMRGLFGHR